MKPIEDYRTLDDNGIMMPWYVRPLLEILETWDFNAKNIFEFGCGDSTFWYRSRGAMTSGAESNPEWAAKVGYDVIQDRTSYLERINTLMGYDIVIIDGDYRDDCIEYAFYYLKSTGIIILDNWLQPEVCEEWPKTEKFIKSMKLNLKVFSEPEHPSWKTAVVYGKKNNPFGE